MAIPSVHMAAQCVVDGEDSSTEIMETDIVTCAARVVLTRHSHLAAGKNQAMLCTLCLILHRGVCAACTCVCRIVTQLQVRLTS